MPVLPVLPDTSVPPLGNSAGTWRYYLGERDDADKFVALDDPELSRSAGSDASASSDATKEDFGHRPQLRGRSVLRRRRRLRRVFRNRPPGLRVEGWRSRTRRFDGSTRA